MTALPTRIVPLLAIPLLAAGCATGGAPRAALSATLSGVQVAPGPGDADGIGTALFRTEPAQRRLCWTLNARQIDAATEAHIHRGAEGSVGAVVVSLSAPGADGVSDSCVSLDPAIASEIALGSHRFYVDVHNAAFPGGAIRGQLRGAPQERRRLERRPAR
jgi:hypothetical protein